jgi:hypothetical protein
MDTEKWNLLNGVKNWMKQKGIATDEILKMYDADFGLVVKHESDEEYFRKLHESRVGVSNLELDANGLLIHEEITNSFNYKGCVFTLTSNNDDVFTIVDSEFTIKESGIDLYDLVTIVQNKWDESLKLNKKK